MAIKLIRTNHNHYTLCEEDFSGNTLHGTNGTLEEIYSLVEGWGVHRGAFVQALEFFDSKEHNVAHFGLNGYLLFTESEADAQVVQ